MTDDRTGAGVLQDSAPRTVLFSDARSGLRARATLLDALAPASAALLWDLAGAGLSFPAMHAMWTGPEISLPIDGAKVLPGHDLHAVPAENTTSFPNAGDVALVCAPRGTWRDGPPYDLVDVGLFYAAGGRLLMPMGWIMANICARIVDEDQAAAAAACRAIRSSGACAITITRGA